MFPLDLHENSVIRTTRRKTGIKSRGVTRKIIAIAWIKVLMTLDDVGVLTMSGLVLSLVGSFAIYSGSYRCLF